MNTAESWSACHKVCTVNDANGRYERLQAAVMLERTYHRHGLWLGTIGADGNYKAGPCLAALAGDGIALQVPLSDGPIRGDDKAAAARRRAKRPSIPESG
jgi:hypothetical protein